MLNEVTSRKEFKPLLSNLEAHGMSEQMIEENTDSIKDFLRDAHKAPPSQQPKATKLPSLRRAEPPRNALPARLESSAPPPPLSAARQPSRALPTLAVRHRRMVPPSAPSSRAPTSPHCTMDPSAVSDSESVSTAYIRPRHRPMLIFRLHRMHFSDPTHSTAHALALACRRRATVAAATSHRSPVEMMVSQRGYNGLVPTLDEGIYTNHKTDKSFLRARLTPASSFLVHISFTAFATTCISRVYLTHYFNMRRPGSPRALGSLALIYTGYKGNTNRPTICTFLVGDAVSTISSTFNVPSPTLWRAKAARRVSTFDTVRGGTHCLCGLGCEADDRRKGGGEAKEREHVELSMRRGLEMLSMSLEGPNERLSGS
ncbi:hypothetical protein PENSPDRAFT_740494 [Peniophora sp. CONT]|nr:hypothetical protein PENSPDRAFT_740494 [Peniophora sp. CONT]